MGRIRLNVLRIIKKVASIKPLMVGLLGTVASELPGLDQDLDKFVQRPALAP